MPRGRFTRRFTKLSDKHRQALDAVAAGARYTEAGALCGLSDDTIRLLTDSRLGAAYLARARARRDAQLVAETFEEEA